MESKIRFGYDAQLVLRAPGSAAMVADTTMTKIGLDRIEHSVKGALNGKYENREFAVVVHLEAGFAAGSDNVYSLEFTTYDSAGANPTLQRAEALVAADLGKTLVFVFDTGNLNWKDADAGQFSLVLNVTGTNPSGSLWAFVAPYVGR